MRVAIFGLGEAGSAFATDLAQTAGVAVHAYDPAGVPTPEGVTRHTDPRAAVADSDIVLALTAAADAPGALSQALDSIPKAAIYADFATAAAGLKQRLGAEAAAAGLAFVDVALMAPVLGAGLRAPALASGCGARRFVDVMGSLGMPVEYSGEEPGSAATRKLLRSVVIKGLAALLIESMHAAQAAGLADETWANLLGQFARADEAFLRRIVDGTGPHAHRRHHEMQAAADLLAELGVDPVMTAATVESLRRIEAGASLPSLPSPPALPGLPGLH